MKRSVAKFLLLVSMVLSGYSIVDAVATTDKKDGGNPYPCYPNCSGDSFPK